MPKKESSKAASTVKLNDVHRQDILRIIFDKSDMEPPVGERYNILLPPAAPYHFCRK